MTKLIMCDICDKEIDVNAGMSVYESIRVKKMQPFKVNQKPEISKTTLDICADCSENVEQYFKELKKKDEADDN